MSAQLKYDRIAKSTASSSSSASSAESDTSKAAPEDQFVFSPHQTPGVASQPAYFAPVQGAASNLTRALTQANQNQLSSTHFACKY